MSRTEIAPVKPPVAFRSYSNPQSQGTLVAQTRLWPKKYVPDGCTVGTIYIDRVYHEEPYNQFVIALGGRGRDKEGGPQQMGIATLFERATDEQRIKAASHLFELEVLSARCVFHFNVSNGYPCERIEGIVKYPFRVYWPVMAGSRTVRKEFHPGGFYSRQAARQFCRNKHWDGMVIVHADGTKEPFTWGEDQSDG